MGLNDAEVKRQIEHMMAFIHQEAKEKADEIDAKAKEEFNIEKGRLVQQERLKIMNLYEKKEKQVELQKKIQRSNFLNQARLKILKAQDDHIQVMLEDAKVKLGNIRKDTGRYKQSLEGLILQGLLQILEPEVKLRCRRDDVENVKQVRDAVMKAYTSRTKKTCAIEIDMEDFLSGECSGGVEISSKDGRIRVVNTLESRLDMLSRQMSPEIRTSLFGPNLNRKFFT